MLLRLARALYAKVYAGLTARSGRWPAVRKAFLAGKCCEACGSLKSLEAHHVAPFHEDPARELDPSNLMALCRRCHLLLGHLDCWRSVNRDARADAAALLRKILTRPR